MRTKNLNLKKKIAFIASVAMIASTAAYLPTEVFADHSDTVKVQYVTAKQTYNAVVADVDPDGNQAIADAAGAAKRANDTNKVTTFDAFVKVNGKYLAYNATAGSEEYKLVNSKTSLPTNFELVSALDGVDFIDKDDDAPFYDTTTGKNATYNDIAGNYNVMTATAGQVIQIPYFAEANPEIELEFAAKKKAALGSKSATSITVTLNDNGMAKIPTQSQKVVGISDTSNYDETTKSFGNYATAAAAAAGAKGSYDELDLSGVVIQMASQSKEEIKSMEKDNVGDLTAVMDTAANEKFVVNDANAAWTTEEENLVPSSFMVKKVGGVYANVMILDNTGTALTTGVDPNTVITAIPNFFNTWTVKGNGYSQSKNELTLTMGENGWAESGLITATKDNNNKEYFVFVVENNGANKVTTNTAEKQVKISGVAGLLAAGSRNAGTGVATIADLDTVTANRDNAENRFKVTRKLTTDKLKNGTTVFVNEYTVYNNELDSEYSKSSATDRREDIITINATGTFALPDGAANTVAGKLLGSADNAPINGYTQDGSTYLITDNTGAWETGATANKTILLQKTSAGEAESGIISYNDGTNTSYIKLIFKNDYKIKFDDGYEENDTGFGYDGKVDVDSVKITKPADGVKPGYEFRGWKNADTTHDIFSVDFKEQLSEDTNEVTPNTKLLADYAGYRYDVVAKVTDGYLELNGSGAAPSAYVRYNGQSKPTTATLSNTRKDDPTITDWEALNEVTAVKEGYTFKGWALTENAKVAMTKKEFDKAFPGENKELKVYPVLVADDAVNFIFHEIRVSDTTGAALATDGKKADVDSDVAGDKDAWNEGANVITTSAKFAKASDGVKTGESGEKVGALPTPIKKGYEFEGWYAKYVDATTKLITAKKVTEDTIIGNDIFYRDGNGAVTAGTVVLYAKFVQKTYNITFDLNGGSWTDSEYDDSDSTKPVTFKYFNNKLRMYNADGTIVYNADAPVAFTGEAHVGSNDFQEFDGWTINGGTSKIQQANLYNEIAKIEDTKDLVIKAVYSKTTASKNKTNIFINANGGSVYYAHFDSDGKADHFFTDAAQTSQNWAVDALASGDSLANPTASTGAVSAVWKVDDNTLTSVTDKTKGFVVARPGYTFTGWYKDADCTEKYTFGNYPSLGNEDIVYAGWKANKFTRYRLNYDLLSADGTIVGTDQNRTGAGINGYTHARTRTGETGTIVDASKIDKLIVKEGEGTQAVERTYVYSAKLSDTDKTSAEIKAKFAAASLNGGQFVEDANQYVNIYGRFVPEGTQTQGELGKATNVKVAADGTVTFKAADNAVKYQVCKIVNGTKYHSAKVDATSIKITPAKQDYSVYVIAFDENGKSTHSETVKVTVKSSLGVVKNPKVTESMDGDKKIGTVTWDKVEGATWYKVFKIVNGKRYWGSKVTSNTYVFKNLPTTSSYIIYVAAGDDNGNVTYSARTKISKYPQVKNVKISADKKTVTFDKAQGAVEYQVAKLVNNTSYYSEKSDKNSITLKNAAKSGQQVYVLAFFKGEDGKTYSSYSDAITVE